MKSWFLLILVVCLCLRGEAEEVPKTLLLTWEGDPCTTMTAQWLRGPGLGDRPEEGKGEVVKWKEVQAAGWKTLKTSASDFPDPEKLGMARWGLVGARWHDLKPDTDYLFQIGEAPVRKFRSAPDHLRKPVVFVEGGDVDVMESSAQIMRVGSQQDPLFMSVGGDLAYGDGHDVVREIKFWEQWSEVARAPDGRIIPFVAGIGNHEVRGGYVQEGATFAQMKERAPFFYALFGGLYRKEEPVALDFGDYLSLLLMDSGHVLPIPSQTAWLKKNLEMRKSVPWVFASWHVPAFPSFRTWKHQKEIVQSREEWVPVLEASEVTAVFNHHEHNLQRVETEGKAGRKIPFLGNGALGVEARPQQCPESKELSKAFSQSDYVNVVQLRADGVTVRSLGPKGEELDRLELKKRAVR
jgi:acid phosphatase type 7